MTRLSVKCAGTPKDDPGTVDNDPWSWQRNSENLSPAKSMEEEFGTLGENSFPKIRLAAHKARGLRVNDRFGGEEAEIPRIVARLRKVRYLMNQNSGDVFGFLLVTFLGSVGGSGECCPHWPTRHPTATAPGFRLREKRARRPREKGVEGVILKAGFPRNLSSTFHQQPP